MSKVQLKIETIEKMLRDADWRVRAAAMNACDGRDVPIEVIERWLHDEDRDVRAAAMNACVKMGRQIPASRTFEPPEQVYKKCIGGVIVVAEIPHDAHVRGGIAKKCRASAARIVDIIGDLYGEKVGISLHDNSVSYRIGDAIAIEDFDLSNKECSSGFHFFCSLDEAKNFQL